MPTYNIISFLGIFVLIGFAMLLSTDRRNMNWRVIGWGIGLQLLFGLFIFRFPVGRYFFVFLNDAVIKVLESATAGIRFLFGPLADVTKAGPILAVQVFPTIVFFSALMAVLYYLNIMPLIIRGFAWFFTRLMNLSGAESLCASSNIFVGIESALTIKPHLNDMTRSELCTILTAGMATVASSVMIVYVGFLEPLFPMIAGHLVSASILSAPAALVLSKVLLPESETPETLGKSIQPHYEKEDSLFAAIINGANTGLKLVGGIMALLIAVIGLVALVNLLLRVVGGRINPLLGFEGQWSLEAMLGYVFYPFTLIIGVPPADAGVISKIIGERVILTEVLSYQHLAAVMDQLQDPRSALVAAYALCGFAHMASMAIFIGGISALAPKKTRMLSQVGFRALLAATLACLMTACVAGALCTDSSILLGP